jgi:DNA-binding NtrC family response regulator
MSAEPPSIVGAHPLLIQALDLAKRAAQVESPILITGEPGTGKSLVARSIHARGPRFGSVFVSVGCSSVTPELFEQRLNEARGGTLFLSHVSELTLQPQARLSAYLSERDAGGAAAPQTATRLIAAADQDLALQVKNGLFRKDLYYRLAVLQLSLPPLRERRSDIPALAKYFLDLPSRAKPGVIPQLTDEALTFMWQYDWPGNVRELANVIDQMTTSSSSASLGIEALPTAIRRLDLQRIAPEVAIDPKGMDLDRVVQDFEDRLIDEALKRTRGNKQAAAHMLGLKRTTLVAKLRRREI